MKTKTLQEIYRMDSLSLTSVIDYWKEYTPDSILIVYAELKRRKYLITGNILKKLNECCVKYEFIDIDESLNSFLKENNVHSYEEYYENQRSIINEQTNQNIKNVSEEEKLTPQKQSKNIIILIVGVIGILFLFKTIISGENKPSNSSNSSTTNNAS